MHLTAQLILFSEGTSLFSEKGYCQEAILMEVKPGGKAEVCQITEELH